MCKKICITLSIILLILLCMGIPRSFAAAQVKGPNCSNGHSYAKIPTKNFLISAATCKSPARYYYSCAICKVKSNQTFTYGAIGDHVPVKSATSKYLAKAATCTEPATYYYKCQSCNAVLKNLGTYSSGTTSGHSFGAWKTTKAATCTAKGTKTRVCSICGHKETETIKAAAHKYSTWKITKAATCTDDGTKTRKCSKCGNVQTKAIAALGHNYSSWEITKAATCTDDGTRTRKCSKCGDVQTETINASGHNYDSWEITKAATCTTKGTQTRKCLNCGDVQTETIKAGHNYSSWEITKNATCTVKGTQTRKCLNCGLTQVKTIKALGHNYSEATCTEPAKCTRCGKTSGKALGHNIVNGKCTRCGFTQEIDKYSFAFDSSLDSWVYVPHLEDIKTYENMPVIIYLHGGSGTATKEGVIKDSLPKFLYNQELNVNALILCPLNDGVNAKTLINQVKEKYSIDEKRISITGHSTGAYYAIYKARSNPGFFSACVPVSLRYVGTQYWVKDLDCAAKFVFEQYHDYNQARQMADQVKSCVNKLNNPNITWVQTTGTYHTTVTNYYKTSDILTWMISQSR